MALHDDYLIDTLVDLGYVTREQVDQLMADSEASAEGVIHALTTRGMIPKNAVTQAKAAHYGFEVVDLAGAKLEDDAIAAIPRHVAKRYRVIPLYKHGNSLAVVISDPSDLNTIDTLNHLLNAELEIKVATEEEIEAALNRYYGTSDGQMDKIIQDITEGEVDASVISAAGAEDDGSVVDADAPIIKLVNQLIVDAFKQRASDIHLEPMAKRFRVRYRIDGVLHEQKDPPKRLQASIISRLKIQSNMSIAERRVPQDGRIQTSVGGKLIDLRVSCLPTNHGESIVMRILDKESLRLGLPELGFFTDDQQTMEKIIGLPDGIFLVTGPTGSGKTTTLYAVLNYINRPDRKIITVEDPVEYILGGINQVQVSELVGLTFSAALRSMLRQAPNIIMLGEIRDLETASIAINASLTGHLVFSTLHTNDAPSAVTRLIDIGVKPFLVASSTRAILAQRLVRKVCKKCLAPYQPTSVELASLNIKPGEMEKANFTQGKGCNNCSNTGCRGRMGIFELFVLNDEARKMVYDKVASAVLRNQAREMGMRTLREDGTRKVLAGLTTADEVIRATVGDVD